MRHGFRTLLERAVTGGEMGWLARQGGKYLAIQHSARFLGGKALTGPLMGVLVVVNRCNSKCPMCDIPSRVEDDLPTADLKGLVDQFMELGTSGIGITGGEPLLRKDIFEIVAHARSHRIPVTLNTNGLLLNRPGKIEDLLDAGPTNVNISLDGGTAETHDRLRGGPFFEPTLQAVQALATAARARGDRTTVTLVTVLSETNLDELELIREHVRRTGAHRWGVMPLHNTYRGTTIRALPSERMRPVSEWLQGLTDVTLDNSVQYLRDLDRAWAGEEFPRRCNAGYTSLFVDSRRQVFPCLGYYMMDRPISRLAPGGPRLKDLWYSEEYRAVRREIEGCRACYLNCQAELSYLVPV